MCRMHYATCALFLILGGIQAVHGQGYGFAERGGLWVSGSAGFTVAANEGDVIFMTALSPSARFFLADFLAVGPRFEWTGYFMQDLRWNSLGVGAEGVFAYGHGLPVIPYASAGALFDLNKQTVIAEDYDWDPATGNTVPVTYEWVRSDPGFAIPLAAGMIVRLGDVLGLQVETMFRLRIGGGVDPGFGFAVGFCGIGRKVAVSTLNSWQRIIQ